MRQRERKRWVGWMAVLAVGLMVAGVAAQNTDEPENRGAENLLIDSGRMNNVHFPHRRHQDALADCRICHDLFPMQAGSIKTLKNEGQLMKKAVMNLHCINCHRSMKSQGKKTGPMTCGSCHRP